MRASEPPALSAVFRTIDITPGYPVSLLGYFNDRVSTGVLDPLACRLAGFAASLTSLGFLPADTMLCAGSAVISRK